MAVAGFCGQCRKNVYLDAQWGCPRGHGWNAISGWYDTDTLGPVTPPWLQPAVAAPPEQSQVAPVPATPAPQPAPPPDPTVVLRRLIRNRLEELNLTIAEDKGVYSASRGDEYECAVAVDGTVGRVLLWERLRGGRDPGVRDAVRTLAGADWAVKIVLKQTDVTG